MAHTPHQIDSTDPGKNLIEALKSLTKHSLNKGQDDTSQVSTQRYNDEVHYQIYYVAWNRTTSCSDPGVTPEAISAPLLQSSGGLSNLIGFRVGYYPKSQVC